MKRLNRTKKTIKVSTYLVVSEFFPHAGSFLPNAAEPTQVDRDGTGEAGRVNWSPARPQAPGSRAVTQRRRGCGEPVP